MNDSDITLTAPYKEIIEFVARSLPAQPKTPPNFGSYFRDCQRAQNGTVEKVFVGLGVEAVLFLQRIYGTKAEKKGRSSYENIMHQRFKTAFQESAIEVQTAIGEKWKEECLQSWKEQLDIYMAKQDRSVKKRLDASTEDDQDGGHEEEQAENLLPAVPNCYPWYGGTQETLMLFGSRLAQAVMQRRDSERPQILIPMVNMYYLPHAESVQPECEMSLQIVSNQVEWIAKELFGVRIESLGTGRQCVHFDNGTRLLWLEDATIIVDKTGQDVDVDLVGPRVIHALRPDCAADTRGCKKNISMVLSGVSKDITLIFRLDLEEGNTIQGQLFTVPMYP